MKTLWQICGVFVTGMFRVTHCVLQKKKKKHKISKQVIWRTNNLRGDVWNSGRTDYTDLPNILPKNAKAEFFESNKKLPDYWKWNGHTCGKLA